jgi:hypothetical protein
VSERSDASGADTEESTGASGSVTGGTDAARRLAEIFGEVLPESTSDDRDPQTADRGDDSERWYTENRPPHHDAR